MNLLKFRNAIEWVWVRCYAIKYQDNVSCNFEISVGDTAQLIVETMNVEIEIITDKARLCPENSEVERLCADNTKAKQFFGWQPSYGGREGFNRGLSEAAEWFAQPGNLRGYMADNNL